MPLVGKPSDWTLDTRQGVIRDTLSATSEMPHTEKSCAACDVAWRSLVPMLGTGSLRFYRNGQNGREELPRGKQRSLKLKYAIYEVHAYMSGGVYVADPKAPKAPIVPAIVVEPEPISGDLEAQAQIWIDWIQKTARPFLKDRDADGDKLDEWGMRQALDGAQLLREGVPIEALKDAATMHLPPEARRTLRVELFDTQGFDPAKREAGFHRSLPYVRRLLRAGVNVCFIGGKGTGKSTYVEMLAKADGVGFTAVSCNGETGGADFYGTQRIGGDGGIIEADFSRLLREGGYILLDELDAGDENIMLMLNRLLANRMFKNVLTQEEFKIHPSVRIFSGMNTLGNGATAEYGARNKLDGASLDRWAMGRVRVDLDEDLERHLFWRAIRTPRLHAVAA